MPGLCKKKHLSGEGGGLTARVLGDTQFWGAGAGAVWVGLVTARKHFLQD